MKKITAILHIVAGPLFIMNGFEVSAFMPMFIGLISIAIGVIELKK